MNLLVFILACYGLTQILAFAKIFDRIRPKHYYFRCTMCMGFPVGILMFCAFWISNIMLFKDFLLGAFIYGCISSGASYALSGMFTDEGVNIKHT